jgi:hypothetical protein
MDLIAKGLGSIALVAGGLYMASGGSPSNYTEASSGNITVERTVQVLGYTVTYPIMITSASDKVTIKKITLNRGNCDARVYFNGGFVGSLKEPGPPPDFYDTDDGRAGRRNWDSQNHQMINPVDLKFGEQLRVSAECSKVIEVSVTTSQGSMTYNFPN